ncbi:MAG: TipAS antibiotic-recognition domain-containing protein [Gemmatimonadota bacterium]|nr:TipAS antibiotic-recognition domain-containing protein [Gemmatimonadota bacterium]MDH5758254.1 TipAS antibiotic-recognition domain-containing protein [Gemmatimonadota bacterium]
MAGAEGNPYEKEARERWGDTDAYRESRRRAPKHTDADRATIAGEVEDIEARMAAVMTSGGEPGGVSAMDLAEEARLHIDRWFYPCSHAMHAGLAEMYTADPRFRAHYDERAEGLADFFAEAIRSNQARHG